MPAIKQFYSEYEQKWRKAIANKPDTRIPAIDIIGEGHKLFLTADISGSDNINEEYYIDFFVKRGFACKPVSQGEQEIAGAAIIVGNSDTIALVADKIVPGTSVIILERISGTCDAKTVDELNDRGVSWSLVDATFNFLPTPYVGGVALFAPTDDFKQMLTDMGIKFDDEEMNLERATDAALYEYFVKWAERYASRDEFMTIMDRRLFGTVRELCKHMVGKKLSARDYVFPTDSTRKIHKQLAEIKELTTTLLQKRERRNEVFLADSATTGDGCIVIEGVKQLPLSDVELIDIKAVIIAAGDGERVHCETELERLIDAHAIKWHIAIPIKAIVDLIEQTGDTVNVVVEISDGTERYEPQVALAYNKVLGIVETVEPIKCEDGYLIADVDEESMLGFDIVSRERALAANRSAYITQISHDGGNVELVGRIGLFLPLPENAEVSAFLALERFNQSMRIPIDQMTCAADERGVEWEMAIDVIEILPELKTKLAECPSWELFLSIRSGNTIMDLPIYASSHIPMAKSFDEFDIATQEEMICCRPNDSQVLRIEVFDDNNLIETCWIQDLRWKADKFIACGWLVMRPEHIDDISVDMAFSAIDGTKSAPFKRLELVRVTDTASKTWSNSRVQENQLGRLYTWDVSVSLAELAHSLESMIDEEQCECVLSMMASRQGKAPAATWIGARRTPGLLAEYKKLPQFMSGRELTGYETADSKDLAVHITAKIAKEN